MYDGTFQPATWKIPPSGKLFSFCLLVVYIKYLKWVELVGVHGALPHRAGTAWQTPPVGEKVLLFSVALDTHLSNSHHTTSFLLPCPLLQSSGGFFYFFFYFFIIIFLKQSLVLALFWNLF